MSKRIAPVGPSTSRVSRASKAGQVRLVKVPSKERRVVVSWEPEAPPPDPAELRAWAEYRRLCPYEKPKIAPAVTGRTSRRSATISGGLPSLNRSRK